MKYIKIINPSDKQVNEYLVDTALYTLKEWAKLDLLESFWYFDSNECRHLKIKTSELIKEVEINKNNTYFFFGFRFNN